MDSEYLLYFQVSKSQSKPHLPSLFYSAPFSLNGFDDTSVNLEVGQADPDLKQGTSISVYQANRRHHTLPHKVSGNGKSTDEDLGGD